MNNIEDICKEIAITNSTQFNSSSFMAYLSKLEQDNQFKFPEDYKFFCNQFGTGEFNDGNMTIIAPFIGLDHEQALIIQRQIKIYPNKNNDYDRWILRLINESIFFAIDGASNYYFWDMNTYKKSDDSYDIYTLTMDDFEDIVKIGRSFSSFLNDFCVNKTKKVLNSEIAVIPLDEQYVAHFRKCRWDN